MTSFLKQSILHPISVGAIAPSGRALAQKMMEPIRFSQAQTIVEYGPGTGAFTRELCTRKKPETRLVLIEQNETFYGEMRERFGALDNVTVLRGSAEDAALHLDRLGFSQADYVVSGLPFTSLPRDVSLRVFAATQRILGSGGRFITFQYTLLKEQFFLESFDMEERLFVLGNLPPAFVFVCKNKDDYTI